MMKILHSADWHLDSPLLGFTPAQTAKLKKALLEVPFRVVQLAREAGCSMMLLSGDLFDGACTAESLAAAQQALAEAGMPVCIAPGNHDPMGANSPWSRPGWSENVHIFTGGVESIAFPALDCRVYGAAFTASESAPLLEGFRAECGERYALGVFHGDPTAANSPHNPITQGQVRESGLDYLALGHIHKGGSLRAGDTLCAWPGCAMGRGFDELGEKGVLLVTLADGCDAQFVPLGLPRFHWLKTSVQDLAEVLPAAGSDDHFRVELVGESEPPELAALAAGYPQFPNLQLRDRTVPPMDVWAKAGDDTLEGVFFSLLQQSDADEAVVQLAARISRKLLSGQEVAL